MSDLWTLAKRNDVTGLTSLFDKGIGAKARDELGATLLHHAAENNALDTMRLLFSKGADVDAKDNAGLTPALRAAAAAKGEAVLLLVANGANPNIKSSGGSTITSYNLGPKWAEQVADAKRAWINRQQPHTEDAVPRAPSKVPVQWGNKTVFLSNKTTSSPAQATASASYNPSGAATIGPVQGRARANTASAGTLRNSGGGESWDSTSDFTRSRGGTTSITVRHATNKHKPVQSIFSDSMSPGRGTMRANRATMTGPSPRFQQMIEEEHQAHLQQSQQALSLTPEGKTSKAKEAGDLTASPAPAPAAATQSRAPAATTSSPAPTAEKSGSSTPTSDSKSSKSSRRKPGRSKSESTPPKTIIDKKKSKHKSDKKKSRSRDAKEGEKEKEKSKSKKKDKSSSTPTDSPANGEEKKKRRLPFFSRSSKKNLESPAKGDATTSAPSTPTTTTPAPAAPVATTPAPVPSPVGPPGPKPNSIPPVNIPVTIAPTSPSTEGVMQRSGSDTFGFRALSARELEFPDEGQEGIPDFVESINLEALTDALCKAVEMVSLPTFGTAKFEVAPLFDTIRGLSAALKQFFATVEPYAAAIPDHAKGVALIAIANEMKTDNTRALFEAIKLVHADPTNTKSLLNAMTTLVISVWKLYAASETVPAEDVVNSLQSAVLATKNLVTSAGTPDPEQFTVLFEDSVIASLRLTALVQEHIFSSIKSAPMQRVLHESCFMEAQAIRGLLLTATEVNKLSAVGQVNPALEQAQQQLTALLKKAAEHVRLIAKALKENSLPSNVPRVPDQLADGVVAGLFNRGIALMSNARDKYISKAQAAAHFADDEKHLLDLVNTQQQLTKTMLFALNQNKGSDVVKTALALAELIVKFSQTLEVFGEYMMLTQFLQEEILLGLESFIRTDIQVKILACAAALKIKHVPGLDFQNLGYLVQLWGSHTTYLLDTVFRAAQSV